MEKVDGILLNVNEEDIEFLKHNPHEFWNGVTSIGATAFLWRGDALTNIRIPDGIKSIGNSGFGLCKSLTEIKIPDSVTHIGEGALAGCSSLANIIIPKYVTNIADSTFARCNSLKEITIPNRVTSIGNNAFAECSSLMKVEIPESVTSIGDYAFINCSALPNIIIPENVTHIGESAFEGCDSLTNVTIPNRVTRIGKKSFAECSSLVKVKISDRVTSIGEYAFVNCSALSSIIIPESVTVIGEGAFDSCNSLKEITIPKRVTSIGNNAFAECSSLMKVEIPDSVTQIGESAFDGIPTVYVRQKTVLGDLFCVDLFEYIKKQPDCNLKLLHSIYALASEQDMSHYNVRELIALSANLGMLEPKTTVVETGKDKAGKPVMTPVNNIAYTFMQGIIKNKQIDLNQLHMNLHAMKVEGYNEAFMKFVVNKFNWSDIKENMNILARVYDWFKNRTELDLMQTDGSALPTTEENRFKVLVYETAENGADRMHWRVPTMEYLIKEFAGTKFSGINTPRDAEIAEEIARHNIYTQKHFDKAKEIDRERVQSGVKDILAKPVKQGRVSSLDQYRKETQQLYEQMLSDFAEVLRDQIENTSAVFTYEVLSKSEPVNFTIGCLTSCCATLYGTGAGAMRGMIIHPDMQPLVIRNFDNHIVAFGILYVNRSEGYAVVNNFEVNKKYEDAKQREAIYKKAMQGVTAFVEQYNRENSSKPIKKVTCGISPNWAAINDFIAKNPQSEILEAPNFDDFRYVGVGMWPGDWHRKQYEILNMEDGRGL